MTTPTAVPTPSQAPEGVTLSFKGGAGYDASLLVLRAATVGDMNQLLQKDANELADLMKRMAQVQAYSTTLNQKAPDTAAKTFQNGRVQTTQSAPAGTPDDPCPHGRKLVEKAGWAALFCQAADKNGQCEPLWRQKDGSYKAK